MFIINGTAYRNEDKPTVSWTIGTTALMAFWWITEAVPLPITALLPLVLFPLTGVMDGDAVASHYVLLLLFFFNHFQMNSTQFLMIGGFLLALAMEKWDLHRVITFSVIHLFFVREFHSKLSV